MRRRTQEFLPRAVELLEQCDVLEGRDRPGDDAVAVV